MSENSHGIPLRTLRQRESPGNIVFLTVKVADLEGLGRGSLGYQSTKQGKEGMNEEMKERTNERKNGLAVRE